jgi:hypothetical protein
MLQVAEMLDRAERCEAMADGAPDANVVYALRDAAKHWRDMAMLVDLLEREPSYRIIRSRND